MAFQVSPGVRVREIDLTNVVPAVSTSIGGFVGAFKWGPVEEIVTISSEGDLVNRFREPDNQTFRYFIPAAQFLQYSNNLQVVRAEQPGALNATSSVDSDGTPVGRLVKNRDDFELQEALGNIDDEVIAKYPSKLGNSLQVWIVTNEASFEELPEAVQNILPGAPFTTPYADERNAGNDEMHVVVVDADGSFSGSAGTVLEVFDGLSQASGARREDGTNNFFADRINTSSRYIWIGNSGSVDGLDFSGVSIADMEPDTDGFKQYVTSDSAIIHNLGGGSNGSDATLGAIQSGYDKFSDATLVDVNFLIATHVDSGDVQSLSNYLINLADSRKDCVAFVSPPVSATVNTINAVDNVLDWASGITSSSYGVLDSTAVYVYDKYNDVFRWVIAAGTVAGLCANTDLVADPWFSPAGFNRGQVRGVTRLALNPTKTQRDNLYRNRVNPIVSFPGEGIVLFGDKTAQSRPSAFDRINVRRLFITLQKAISTAAQFQLFELNDEFTRSQFVSLIEPFLRDVQGRRGITDFRVVCDETNNTGEVIDSNRFVADILVRPARSINFITLNFVAVRTGVEFSEIAGRF